MSTAVEQGSGVPPADADAREGGLGDYARQWWENIRSGELGIGHRRTIALDISST